MKKNKFIAGMLCISAIALAVILIFGITACKEPSDNERAELTGTVTIPALINLDDTVQANTTGLGGSGVIKYQWQTGAAEDGSFKNIEEATVTNFRVRYSNPDITVGRYLRVTVTRADNRGSVSSAAVKITVSTTPLPGEVTIPSSISLDGTVTANTDKLGGSGPISYQWQRKTTETSSSINITDATEKLFTITGNGIEVGRYLRVKVTRISNEGSVESEWVQIGPSKAPLSGLVTIPAAIALEGTYSPDTSELEGSGEISYQWQIGDSETGTFNNIETEGAKSRNFTVEGEHVEAGRYLRVRVSRANNPGSVPSNAVKIGPSNTPLGGSITITPNPANNTVALDGIYFVNINNLGGSGTVSYQWQVGDSDDHNGTFTDITDASSSSFTVGGAGVTLNRYLRVSVSRTSNVGSVESFAYKIGASNAPLSGEVKIPEEIAFGDTIQVNTNALGGSGTIIYQWQISSDQIGPFANITGATNRSFNVEGAGIEEGYYLRVRVYRASNSGFKDSNAAEIVQARTRALIDFSGYTGSLGTIGHQPSSATPGVFSLPNGIKGEGLRLNGDAEGAAGAVVIINEYGAGTNKGFATQIQPSGGYQYFNVDHTIIKTTATLTLKLTFFDNSSGNFHIQYAATGNDFQSISFSRSNSNSFVTHTVQLDNCNFTKTGITHRSSQFRISGDVPIQRIALTEGGIPDPMDDPPPEPAAPTAYNNMIGKGIAGYQAWFTAPGSWHHWTGTGGTPGPGNASTVAAYQPGNLTVELWPAGIEEYAARGATLHNTNFVMPDGSPARVFNSHDRDVIFTQVKWMQDAGIDGMAPQRFYGTTSPVDTGDAPSHLTHIRDASEQYGRIFYVMYDMSGAGLNGNPDQDAVVKRMQLDWIYNIENKGLVSSPSYAQIEGKPVVCIWGVHALEDTDSYRYIAVEATIELVQWFRDRGYYIIGGVPDDDFFTRTGRGKDMYAIFDMISPWYIGRDINGQVLSNANRLNNGLAFCDDNRRSWANNRPISFMPTVWPGFAWTNMNGNSGEPNAIPRNGGQWIWRQIQEYLNRDTNNIIQNIYLAMFDEYDEATAWMKGGVDYFDIPVNQYFKTHSADGLWLSSDYYMRMAKAAIDALKKKIAAGGGSTSGAGNKYTQPLNDYSNASSVIVEHSLGPIFWRNSFERRTSRQKYGQSEGQEGTLLWNVRGHLQIDVGVPNGGVVGTPQNVTVTGPFTVNRTKVEFQNSIQPDNYTLPAQGLGMVYTPAAGGAYSARSGDSAFRLAGTRTAGNGASYIYRIANTRIKANSDMSLTYWIRTENALDNNVGVDLRLANNGAYLSSVATASNVGSPVNGWQQKKVDLPAAWNGQYITEVLITYRDTGTATGGFAALVDDIIIMKN